MAMSVNGQNLVNYLKGQNGADLTVQDVAEALGVSIASITGTFNALEKKGLGERVPAEVQVTAKVNLLKLTEEGMAFDPAAEDEVATV